MNPIVAQKYRISYNGLPIGRVRSFSLSVDSGQIDATSWDVDAFNRYLKGRADVTVSVTAWYTRGQDAGHELILSDSILQLLARPFEIAPVSPETGNLIYTGTARPSSVEITGEDDEAVEVSFDLQVSRTFVVTAFSADDFILFNSNPLLFNTENLTFTL